MYNVAFPQDLRKMKAIVWTVYLLEIVQVILATHDAFITLAKNCGDAVSLSKFQFFWLYVPVITGISRSIHDGLDQILIFC